MTPADWASDIALARSAGIDGFALNIAAGDPNTDRILGEAYSAAEAAAATAKQEGKAPFTLFLSFDYLAWGPWSVERAVSVINRFQNSPAQFRYAGKSLVSTFEGVDNIADWRAIKAATNCFFIPDWSSLGPGGLANHLSIADGAFAWDAWGEGTQPKTAAGDWQWMAMLGPSKKPFMMAVSPWFYTNLPQWGKNWVWRPDELWHPRWLDVVRLQPQLVQILSWNDFGESHYIGPVRDGCVPPGADYVGERPHTAWLKFLPYYIEAYKAGGGGAAIGSSAGEDAITYWYKLHPGTSGSAGGTTGNSPGHGQTLMAPHQVSQDKVFVSVLVREPSEVVVAIGGGEAKVFKAERAGISLFTVSAEEQTGEVRICIRRGGGEVAKVVGPEIRACCAGECVNWNAFVGSS